MYGAAKKRDTHRLLEWGSKMRKEEGRGTRRQEDKRACEDELEQFPFQDYQDFLCTCPSCMPLD